MGLIHHRDMAMWREWAQSRHRLRRAKHAVAETLDTLRGRSEEPSGPAWALHSKPGEREQRILIAVDSTSPTSRASLLTCLPYLSVGVDVLAPAGLELPELEAGQWESTPVHAPADLARMIRTDGVLSIGHHLGAGEAAHHLAQDLSIPELVVQHGALTPYAPPLPEGAHLLAWSSADAAFWSEHRSDVTTEVVGSQLLWQAAHAAPAEAETTGGAEAERPIFLGQLHGAELSRRITGGAAARFCRREGAIYRPHPSETDALSRLQHRLWARRGIEISTGTEPLASLPNPVVSVFSTGVLEAAVRGREAWVFCPAAPAWVHELWDRYGMHRWGGVAPTPAPLMPDNEPAARIAQIVEGAV